MSTLVDRKLDHVRLCLDGDVEAPAARTGFGRYAFLHEALPDLSLAEVDASTTFLGKRLSAPIVISSMTGGPALGGQINRNLATAAQRVGVALALGSQRVGLERPEAMASFQVRDVAPDVLLVGNLGAVQLNCGVTPADCRKLVDAVGADALYLHLNPLQEAIQPEGDTDFRGLLPRIGQVCAELGAPVLVKEVGNGLAPATARALRQVGVAALDVAGAGGTSWARIEGRRHGSPGGRRAQLGEVFGNWGIPTAEALRLCREALPDAPLVASGGLRDGIEIAKAIALGADVVGLALPFLQAATTSAEAVEEVLHALVEELRIAMFCLGCRTLEDLRRTDRLVRLDG